MRKSIKIKNKDILLALMLLTGTICIVGCKKTAVPASLIGTWTLMSERQVFKIGGITQSDTTIYFTGDTVLYTFTDDWHWLISGTAGQTTQEGAYAVKGNELIMYDTVAQFRGPSVIQYTYTVLSVTDHSLVIQDADSGFIQPFEVYQATSTFSR